MRARDLFQGLDRRELDAATLARRIATFGKTVFAVDLSEVLIDHELNADSRGAFFASFEQHDDIAIQRHVVALEQQQRDERAGDVVFVVDGAAAVDVATVTLGAERRKRPFLRIDVDGVGVRHDQQRAPLAVAFQTRHQIGSIGLEREDLRADAFLVEHLLQIIDRGLLHPRWLGRRVGRIKAHERLIVLECFGIDFGPVDRCGCLRRERCDRSCKKAKRQLSHGPDAITRCSTAGSTGLTRWCAKPAERERRRSSS